MTQIITPTPGRIVWYRPTAHDGIATLNGQPLAAIVAGVHSDTLVNLSILDAYGNQQQRSRVTLVQPGDAVPDYAYAEWMPYQIGQAAKTEEAETQVATEADETTQSSTEESSQEEAPQA